MTSRELAAILLRPENADRLVVISGYVHHYKPVKEAIAMQAVETDSIDGELDETCTGNIPVVSIF